jgi:glycosyltransferase involved in cell wall biosynthesis
MNILHVNTYDKGGAAVAAIRLHTNLLENGVNSHMLFKRRTKQILNSSAFRMKLFSFAWFIYRIKKIFNDLKVLLKIDRESIFILKRPSGLEKYSYPFTLCDITQTDEYQNADIIHLHWVADFLDWKSFFKKNTKPVIWTLHDCNPFLGGQHYNEEYLGVDEKGYPLKREVLWFEAAEEKRLIRFKLDVLKSVNQLWIVANSNWTFELSRNSEVLGRFPHFKINCGYPEDNFKILDKRFCRRIFNSETEKKIILFAADLVKNERKGYLFLIKALETIIIENNSTDFELWSIGSQSDEVNNLFYIKNIGFIQDEKLLAVAYNAADIFIMPSLSESLGMVAVEAQMCGCPVIGFPTGGIKETIQHGVNGFLCEEISVYSLKRSILKFLSEDCQFDREQISNETRIKFKLDKQSNGYINLYRKLLNLN